MNLLRSLKHSSAGILRSVNCFRYRLQGVKIGRGVFISWGAFVDTTYPGSITIEDGAYVTNGAKLIAHDHTVYRRIKGDDGTGQIRIGKNAFIGAGAIILRNVEIGENAIVGAGTVVTKDVAPCTIVAGNPARVIGQYQPIE